ncbi:MAG: carboxypeptidase-like regulatory domain-containing protein [Clostridium sp.]|uniref:carboxypeptidase-like regulatory domain-containing protein n=1 Tax=Clostridium sp. TaxID=1506 RepID=UPI002FC6D65C
MTVINDVRQDMYVLGQSQKKLIDQIGEEIRLDLSLDPNPNLGGGTITGEVVDPEGQPVSGALIKIMSSTYEPLAHTFTASDGTYVFSPFPAGDNYRIFASAPGYELEEALQFSFLSSQSVTKNFTMTADPNVNLGIIAGDAFRSDTGVPINGAAVSLYTVTANGDEELFAVSFTNQYGQFVFSDVPQDSYKVKIDGLGYFNFTSTTQITSGGQIINVQANIQPNPAASRGTVSGLITNSNNLAVPNADVTLYRVGESDTLTPVAYTKTNQDGAYLFINVEEGNYLIKSNKYVIPTTV